MKLVEALNALRRAPVDGEPFRVALACGFTPLHLQTFLTAHLQLRLAQRRVEVATGLFGDLAGTLAALKPGEAAAIAMEWADLDPRLQYREPGGWSPADLADIVTVVEMRARALAGAIGELPGTLRVALSLPTLPLPPVFHAPGWQASEAEFRIRQAAMSIGRAAAARGNTAVVSAGRLDEMSPPAARLDFKADLLTGAPYTMAHADALGEALASLLQPAAPKKGIITDLDDTLWKGIAGEVGAEGVAWDLAGHARIHGLYQQVLRALAGQGVLVGVASKNDAAVVEQAFAREDMQLPPDCVFPMEVHWQAKSGSVGRILKTWNIGADSVVYVDDSPMELAEVAEAHPGIECIRFPAGDYAQAEAFLRNLRDLFAKESVSEEDTLRLESIRQGEAFQQVVEEGGNAPEEFLARMESRVTMDFENAASDRRVLELVNKTNQFNLNGIRYSEGEWQKAASEPGAFVASVAYQDRFGPLGKIAVLRGRRDGVAVIVDAWVMSCRAFARRIEHRCLEVLFERFSTDRIEFEFSKTAKNGPLQDFFAGIPGERSNGRAAITREAFAASCPMLYHSVTTSDRALEAKESG